MNDTPDAASSSAHQAVDRALQVLSYLGSHPSGVSLHELSTALRYPKPSLHRILSSMRARAYAAQLAPGGDYFLGPAALEAAFSFHAGLDLRALLHPLLLEVNRRFDQTCHLASLDDDQVVYLDKVDTSTRIRLSSVIGGRNPAHATGVGKAMLAATLDDDEVAGWVARHEPLAARTEHTATDARSLAATLADTRAAGYAIDDEESEPGLLCVAVRVPLVFARLTPPLAISVTGLKSQMLELGVERIGRSLIELAAGFEYGTPASPTATEAT